MSADDTPGPKREIPGSSGPVLVFLAVLGLALWMLAQSWQASILDRYEFRQLQTALSIFWMQQEGFRLDYLTPLFGPPWSIPMEFPTYQACVAGLSSLLDLPLEQAGRMVSVIFYLATLPAVYGLLVLAELSPSRRLLALAVVMSSPIYLFYPRTVMIETTALCFAVWFLYAMQRTLQSRSWRWLAATCIFAVLAALTKITTFAVYAVPAAIIALAALRRDSRRDGVLTWVGAGRPAMFAALPVALALGGALWWIAHGDSLKHSNPFAGFLASTELRRWNYGPWALRLEPSFWQHLLANVTQNLLSEGALALSLVCASLASARARWIALTCLAGFFFGPLVFANLYHIHDYYYSANALLLTGAAGVLLASAWDNPRLTAAPRWVIVGVMLVLQLHAFDRGYHYYYWKEAPPPPDLATVIRETVPVDAVVLISGDDWNPLLPYYAQRRAVMVAGGRDQEPNVLDDVVSRLPPRSVAAMVLVGDKVRQDATLVRARAERFGLSTRPFASSDNADLYLPLDAIASAATHLAGRKFLTARVLVTPAGELPMASAKETDTGSLNLALCVPAPFRARSQFGVSLGSIDGLPVLYAHAPSELYFQPPPSARGFSAIAGLPAETFAKPAPEATDGVVVEIFEQQPNGLRRSLLRRHLTPAIRATDRGAQELTYDNGGPFSGPLVFTISPGPEGNLSYDQAYWARIEIR
ncbi:MAG: glycosyltransferase family 39 protein [Candidatus Didemnitutus sp.]|nr:glycosyltransferase family 39 protein [Candidatus Didemnitutus sp.]